MTASAGHDANRAFKAGHFALDGLALLQAWNNLVALLPPKHHIMLSGPWADGHLSVNVVNQSKTPAKTRCSATGRDLTEAFKNAAVALTEQEQRAVANASTAQPRDKGRFVKKAPAQADQPDIGYGSLLTSQGEAEISEILRTVSANMALEAREQATPGFTRDRDLVAYLVYKNGRVSQYELRHAHGIKNPAQAINDAELHYHFTMQTGDALPNGDIPYRLVGSAPAIAGTMPMFATGIEDPDEKLYVLELDLYSCVECGRHPVYRPQRIEGKYAGVCPRHGQSTFARI